jgi:Protein of unknown function (DUF998)
MIKKQLLVRLCGGFALAGVLFYFLVAAIVQFLRPDYSFMGTPLSFYLLGPYSGWLQVAFFGLAIAIVLLAIGCYMGSSPHTRSAATLVLFILGAAGVVVTALASTDTSDTLTVHGSIHLLAAAVAFIATSFGMLVQSWRFRLDPAWRDRFRFAMNLATFECLVLLIYALAHIPVSGLMEKITIALILLWLGMVAAWLSLLHQG